MKNAPIFADTVDEIVIVLENDRTFYEAWLATAEDFLPNFFTTNVKGGVREPLCNIPDPERYFTPSRWVSNIYQHMKDLVRTGFGRLQIKTPDSLREGVEWTACYFAAKLAQECQWGNIRLSESTANALRSVYVLKQSKAQTARETGISTHQLNKLLTAYSEEMYTRYAAVQAGKAYEKVMGDCEPYIHNRPEFDPVECFGRDEGLLGLEEGDLVAEWGSSRWYTVSELTSTGGLAFTKTGGILHAPLRRLPRQYREQAYRFCNLVDDEAPRRP